MPSINNEDDAATSAEHCIPHLRKLYGDFDAFLVCCYSKHPLVSILSHELSGIKGKKVTGIFEASLWEAKKSSSGPKFGIVSTGQQWQEILNEAVLGELGDKEMSARFAGTETTGFDANELHTAPAAEVGERMKAAVKRLLAGGATAICLGCAGMAGMDSTVRQACVEALGEDKGNDVRIIDGVLSGVSLLHTES